MEAQEQPAYHYQYQTLTDPNSTPLPLSYDSSSSQLQSYDPSIQTYYASYRHHDPPQQQDNSSHYYSNSSYQTLNSDPNSIHPPGVPILADTQQPHLPNAQGLYYSAVQPSPLQPYTLPNNTTFSSGGSRGRGRGAFGQRGRGRGRGRGGGNRGKRGPPQTPGSSSGPVAPPKPPPQNVSCELCKVECNTLEILEQHKNGKKHQKNLQKFSQPKTKQNNPQIQVSDLKIVENAPTNNPEDAEMKSEAPAEIDESTPKTESSSGLPTPSKKPVRKERPIGRGSKRGRGGKFMKGNDGSRRELVLEPPNPKQLGFPVVCELCNSRCESQVVYDSHIAGKKHLANAKRAQGGLCQTTAIPNLALTSAFHNHQSGSVPNPQDAEALASMMVSQQNLPDPQGTQAALTRLFSEHGIHDAQTLLVQLIPYLLNQIQVPIGSIAPAAVAAPLAGLKPQTQEMTSSLPGSKEEEQNVTNDDVIERGVEKTNDEIKGGVEKNGELGEGDCLDKKPVDEKLAEEDQSVVEKEEQLS